MASGIFKLPGVALITGAAGTGTSFNTNLSPPSTSNPQTLTHIHSLGIGAAVARGFARSGCTRLAITDIKSVASTRASILSINPRAQVLTREGDISSESFVADLFADVAAAFARLDYAVGCAGVLGSPLRSHETPVAEFDRVAAANWKGAWLASRAALARMLAEGQEPLDAHPGQRGAIVHIASQLGIVGRPAAGKSRDQIKLVARMRLELTTESNLLRLQGCYHQYDAVRRDRLFAGWH